MLECRVCTDKSSLPLNLVTNGVTRLPISIAAAKAVQVVSFNSGKFDTEKLKIIMINVE